MCEINVQRRALAITNSWASLIWDCRHICHKLWRFTDFDRSRCKHIYIKAHSNKFGGARESEKFFTASEEFFHPEFIPATSQWQKVIFALDRARSSRGACADVKSENWLYYSCKVPARASTQSALSESDDRPRRVSDFMTPINSLLIIMPCGCRAAYDRRQDTFGAVYT